MQSVKSKEEFFKLQEKLEFVPFAQSKGWHNYMSSKNNDIVYFVDSLEDVKIALWGRVTTMIFGYSILRVDGESYSKDINEKLFKKFYSALTKLSFIGLEINSGNFYNIDYEVGLRRAGFKRPLSFFSCPLTINIDLQVDFKFDNNWKRNVKKAISSKLKFREIKIPTVLDLNAIVKLFSEMAKIKNLNFSLEAKHLDVLINSNDIRTFIVYKDETPITARIIYVNKPLACDIYAANGVEARNHGASYFIMQRILEQLKEEGYQSFDFGRIPPSNHNTDSVYNFKNSSRGLKVQYNGEWVFYKNIFHEYIVHFFKSFIQKSQRY